MDAFISPNDTGGVMKLVDSSAVVDNIFVFTDGTDKFQWTNNRKGVYPLSQAKIVGIDATDKTAILQAVLNHPDIKVVELDAQQEITISGTLNCNGKVLQFTRGSMFKGTAVIDNAVILGEDDDQLFARTITLTNSKSGRSYFSAKWYGATGNGIDDDVDALQKVLDTCVKATGTDPKTNKIKKIFFPAGTYRITRGIYLRRDDAKADTDFVQNITIEGPVSPHSGNYGVDNFTEASIACSNKKSFGLGLQKVKGVRIKNLSIIGPNTKLQELSIYDVVQNPNTNFTPDLISNSSISPCAGVVVDPFSDPACPDKYEGFELLYTAQSRGGSSDIIFENCKIGCFAVGYMISPTGYLQNAERIVIKDSWGDFCKVAIATGQHQTRNVYVENFGCWGGTETVFDTRSYGSATGCPPDVNGLNIAGSVRYLCKLNNWISNGMHIVNMHAELLGSLGGNFTGLSGKLTIKDSWIDLIGAVDYNSKPSEGISIQPAKTQFQGDMLVMENCFLSQYGAAQTLPMNFSVNRAVFNTCRFSFIPIGSGPGANQMAFNNCSGIGSTYAFGDGQIIYGSTPGMLANIPLVFSSKMEWHTGLNVPYSLKRVKREVLSSNPGGWAQSKDLRLIPLNAKVTLTSVDQNSLEATFNIAGTEFLKFLQVGDVLVAYTTDEFGDTQERAYVSFGTVVSPNLATGDVTVKYIMRGATAGAQYFIFLYKHETLIAPLIIGDLTSGSNTITNVLLDSEATKLPIGTMINHARLPEGTYIVSYDHNARIITLSNDSPVTATRQSFVSSDWEGVQIGAPNPYNGYYIGYKIGDRIINNNFVANPNVLYWTCTAPGVTNTSLLPEFAATNI